MWMWQHSSLGPLAWKMTPSLIFLCIAWSYLSEGQTSQDVVIIAWHLGRWIHWHCDRGTLFADLKVWVVWTMQRLLHLAFSPMLWCALYIQRIKWKICHWGALFCHWLICELGRMLFPVYMSISSYVWVKCGRCTRRCLSSPCVLFGTGQI